MSERHPGQRGRRGVLGAYGDLVAIIAVAALVVAAALSRQGWGTNPLRLVGGFAVVFFLPGYAITAALFPTMRGSRGANHRRPPVSALEWTVLSVGLSIAVVPFVGFVLNLTKWGITRPAVTAGVGAVVVVASLVAGLRRWRASPERHVCQPLVTALRDGLAGAGGGIRRGPTAAGIAVGLLVFSGVVVGGTLATQETGVDSTEFSLLANGTEDRRLVAADYPRTFEPGEPRRLFVGIGNHEGRRMTYTVVVLIRSFEETGSKRRVAGRAVLDRFAVTVGPNETRRMPATIRLGERIPTGKHQLAFLLYKGDPPAPATPRNAYRRTHLWISVTE